MNREIFEKGLLELGFNIDNEKIEKFDIYSKLLVEWNKKINLTAITAPEEIAVKHFLDSIAPLSVFEIEKNAKVIDVGTGAGFPGFPIKIMREDLDFTFMDSLNKRINFLKLVAEEIDLKSAEFVHMRAEDGGINKLYREKFDYVVSRAVANLKVLSEYCIPFLKVGGIFAAFKQYEVDEEIEESKAMIGSLGGKIKEIKEIKIPCSDIVRKIVLIEKVKETPKNFPRKANKIKK
ncbi:MAG: 16S rRNA (guanine(527)-N(7))-methyltransferase RsmG [Clostridia bacterium]|nr:16S rRNA (guanine(527)-N(7))-methyltransferase RsmG [Clostridia bacterium]